MSLLPPLQQIAREKNWMEFALQLETAMARFESYGLTDANAVRASVGRLRRQLPSSLTTALKAMAFLREHHADVLAARDARIGCAPVRLLARIDETSPVAAAELAPRVFARTIRQAELRLEFEALRRQARLGRRLARAA